MKKLFTVFIVLAIVGVGICGSNFPPPDTPGSIKTSDCANHPNDVCVESDGALKVGSVNQNALLANLSSGLSCALNILGDSTSNETDEWPYLVGQWLAEKYPNYNVAYHLYDNTNERYRSGGLIIQYGTNGERYIESEGSNRAYCDDGDIADFASDPDIRIKIRPSTWSFSAEQILISHWGSSAPNRSFYFQLTATGKPRYVFSDDGTNSRIITCDDAITVGMADSYGDIWLRVTHDLDNGSGDSDITFYRSANGYDWTQIGAVEQYGSTTSIQSVDASWQLFARNSTISPFTGRIYQAYVFDGIDNAWPPLNSQVLDDLWTLGNSTLSFDGGPNLRIFNGSVGGADCDYFDDATRRPKINPDSFYNTVMTIISSGHNEGATYDSTKIAEYTTLASNLVTANPFLSVVFATQNPRVDPASNILPHAYRNRAMVAYMPTQGYPVIDVHGAFDAAGSWTTESDDGIHPDASAHSTIWALAIESWLGSQVPSR